VTLSRIAALQKTLDDLRQKEANSTNRRLSSEGFSAEIDRMNLEVREYVSLHPSEMKRAL